MARRSGVRKRHSRTCATHADPDARCNCKPSFEAAVWDRRKRTKVRKTFRSQAEATTWLIDAEKASRDGRLAAPSKVTVKAAGDAFLTKAVAGVLLTRAGARYKPSVIRGYEADMRNYVVPALGSVRLSEIRRRDVQDLVDELVRVGLSGSKVRNVLMPLRAIVRHAIENDDLAVNPTANLRLPGTATARERVASPDEAAQLLTGLAGVDRPLWATAFYAGLRLGELRGLRDEDVDLDENVIHVRRGWDAKDGEIAPKSAKGTRDVPVAGVLRLYLLEQRARTGRRGADLFFGRTAAEPFTPSHIRKRASRAWAATIVGAFLRQERLPIELVPIGLHECRHTYVSLMHAAGLSLEEIGDYVGHSSTYMTDRYRHLLDGQRQKAADALDAFVSGAHSGAQHSTAVESSPASRPKVATVQAIR